MPIVNMRDMMQHAYDNGYAVGAFDIVSLDFLEAILSAAEQTRAPVILSLAESHFEYFDFELVMAAVEAAGKRATVPVAIHLDHGSSVESAIRGIRYGCNGVMIDTSDRPFDENVALSQEVVELARSCGVPVEGELGYVPGVEGEDAERHPGEVAYTTVEQAREYVDRTGVDFLAVSIGTVHGRMKGEPQLDFERLDEINRALNIPLVIHGGTGLGDDQFRKLISHGVCKINYYTALADVAGASIRANAATGAMSATALVSGTREAIGQEVERCIELWGSGGRAEQVLEYSARWNPVDHVIIFNVGGISETEACAMMESGQQVLGKIPGVREVSIGAAVKSDAAYRYAWLIRFCHPAVIDSYREHPVHVDFADNLFRPVATRRISIDYQSL